MRCVRYSLQIKVLLGEVYSDSLIQGMVQLGWSSTSRSRVQEPGTCLVRWTESRPPTEPEAAGEDGWTGGRGGHRGGEPRARAGAEK